MAQNPTLTVEEATTRLLTAFLKEFADRADDELIPIRMFLLSVGRLMNSTPDDYEGIPVWETVGWLRERVQSALAELAARGDR